MAATLKVLRSVSEAVEDFRAAMAAAGIQCTGEICCDGRLHRFKAGDDRTRNSWYVLHAEPPFAGAFGCWKRGIKSNWRDRNGSESQAEEQHVRECWEAAKRERERVETDRHGKAQKTAAWILKRSRRVLTHTYLAAKNVKVFGEMRESYRGELVLPLRDINRELHSLQFINIDGEKRFLTGGRVKGCFFTLSDKADGPIVASEGYATGASVHEATGHAVICAMNSGNLPEVAKALREKFPQREIIIAADNDQFREGNPGLTKATEAAKAIRAKLAVPQFKFIALAGEPTDFNDIALLAGLGEVKRQIQAASEPGQEREDETAGENSSGESDHATIRRLAAMSVLEYERCREAEAERIGCRVSVLDSLVEAKRRPKPRDDTLQGVDVTLEDVEPWPEPVNGAEVLDAIANKFRGYVAMPNESADAAALWCAHAHCPKAFQCSPRLNFTSPEKNCGKTIARDVTAFFVPRPVKTENFTTAVLFRLAHAQSPVILADEYDAWLRHNEELRGLLNAGHRQGAMVYRCEGDNNAVRGFRCYGPAVLCGIGALPGTLDDRSIKIRLERAKRGEVQAEFDQDNIELEKELCRKLARWILDNQEKIKNCNPRLPEGAYNRLKDNWRPLVKIAEVAGGDWPRRTAEAFRKLTSTEDLDAQGIGTLLLTDIANTFLTLNTDRIPSAKLAESLVAIEGRPWAEWGKHRKPISPNQLANQLHHFGISPHKIRFGETTLQGYDLADFKDAFERYLLNTPNIPLSEWNTGTTLGKTAVFETEHSGSVFHPEKAPLQRECSGVPLQKGGQPDIDAISTENEPATTPDTEPAGCRVPLMITRQMEAELLRRGLTRAQISKLTPPQAHEILSTPVTPASGSDPQIAADIVIGKDPEGETVI